MAKLAFKEGPRGGRTRISSIWFSNKLWNITSARKWLKDKNFKVIKGSKVEKTPNFFVFKIARKIKGARFRTISLEKDKGILARIMAAGPKRKSSRKRSKSPRRRTRRMRSHSRRTRSSR